MKRTIFVISTIILLLCPVILKAAVIQNPLDVSRMDRTTAKKYLKSLMGQPIQVYGVMKDVGELKVYSSRLLYEIPIYSRQGSEYVKYGYVCQKAGSPIVIFAEEGYLSSFVKKNAINKPVLAAGKLMNIKRSKNLPKEMIFLIESLNLKE